MGGWVAIPDDVYADPALAYVGPRAAWLWACGRAYAGQRATDGAIPRLVLRLAGATTKDASKLVEAGLWTTTDDDDGWVDARFLELNASADERGASRAFERERKARRRALSRTYVECPTGTTTGTPGGTTTGLPPGVRHTQSQSQVQVQEIPPSPLAPHDEVPLPVDWAPTDAHRAFAAEHGLRLDLEVAAFRGHAEAHGRTARSWNGAFATWIARGAARKTTTSRPIQQDAADFGFKPWGAT